MRIAIDMQGAQSASRFRGIGRYTISLIEALIVQAREHEVFLILNGSLTESAQEIRAKFSEWVPNERILEWNIVGPSAEVDPGNATRARANGRLYEHFLQSLLVDRILVTSFFEGYVDDAVTSYSGDIPLPPTAVIAYDLIPALLPGTYLIDANYRTFYERKLSQFARFDAFLCISDSTESEVAGILPLHGQSTTPIYAGVGKAFQTKGPDIDASHQAFRDHSYILYPGGFDGRKNLETLIDAYAMSSVANSQDCKLLIVGNAPEVIRKQFVEQAAALGLSAESIEFTGFISDDELVRAYSDALLTVFPSRHEGFGLPILESLSCGTPVIAANAPGSREVLNQEKALFDPDDARALSELIRRAVTDEAFRSQLFESSADRVAFYSWEKAASLALNAVLDMAAKPKATSIVERRKLAYVSPIPPERTGIADYSAELIPALAHYYDIDCVVDQPAEPIMPAGQFCGFVDSQEFLRTFSHYDRVIYHIGNSPFHQHMYALLGQIPGVVLLHDQFHGSFLNFAEKNSGWHHCFWKALYSSHGWCAVGDRASNGDDVAISNWPAHRGLIDDAIGVITHSDNAHRLAREYFGGWVGAKWKVVPFPRRIKQQVERANRKAEPGFQLSSFGFVDDAKAAIELVEAWARTPMRKSEECQLVFVGQNHGGHYGTRLKDRIESLGLEKSVRITGFLSAEDYAAEVERSDAAIQLRKVTRGETSAAVFDCLAAGVPTIVNALGAFCELPNDVVHRIAHPLNPDEIADAMTRLHEEKEYRVGLGMRAQEYATQNHSPAVTARAIADSIEDFYCISGDYGPLTLPKLGEHFAKEVEQDEVFTDSVASAALSNLDMRSRQRTLYLDISAIVSTDRLTGIERTAHEVLKRLIKKPPEGFRCEPCYAQKDRPHHTASTFTARLLGVPDGIFHDEQIYPKPGDVLLALDWEPAVARARQADLKAMQKRGVEIGFFVYDMLPTLHPEWFPDFVTEAHRDWLALISEFDFTVSISRTVADQLGQEMKSIRGGESPEPRRGWFHLGADLPDNSPLDGDSAQLHQKISAKPYVLVVGTVEPRKGHDQLIAALPKVFERNQDFQIVVVGRKGWMVDGLAQELSQFEQEEPNFHWLQSVEDNLLYALYRDSAGLVMTSRGEGFGLPIFEAAQHDKPLLLRDLPVFRELCGSHASYFKGTSGAQLANSLSRWLSAIRKGTAKGSKQLDALSWEQSVSMIRNLINEQDSPNWLN